MAYKQTGRLRGAGRYKQTFVELMRFPPSLSGALFSLDGPATLVRQEDSTGPSLAAARCQYGLPRAVCPCSPRQQQASGTRREEKSRESRERTQKSQGGTVRCLYFQKVHSCLSVGQIKRNVHVTWLILRVFSHLRMRSSKSDLQHVHQTKDEEKTTKGEGKRHPIRNMLPKVKKSSWMIYETLHKAHVYIFLQTCSYVMMFTLTLLLCDWLIDDCDIAVINVTMNNTAHVIYRRPLWKRSWRQRRRRSRLRLLKVENIKKEKINRRRRRRAMKWNMNILDRERKLTVLWSPQNEANWNARQRWKKRHWMCHNRLTMRTMHPKVKFT